MSSGFARTGLLVCAVAICVFSSACGPKCKDVKSAMEATALRDDDIARVNQLVFKRKALMAQGEKTSDPFGLERIKFAVTAHEIAIQTQFRLLEISKDNSLALEKYKQNKAQANEVRCLLDELLASDNGLVSSKTGVRVKDSSDKMAALFEKEGELSERELKDLFESGIKPKEK